MTAKSKAVHGTAEPLYLSDLVENPGLLDSSMMEPHKCCVCHVVLHETITGKRPTPNGEACSDCYYDSLGREIEEHPIASAGFRRS